MRFSSDRTGYPLLDLTALGLEVSLLPVTKLQFERFIAEPNEFGDTWYEQVCERNPRVSWRNFPQERREGLFITAVSKDEALAFARWLGPGFDLPTVEEWRAIYELLGALSAPTTVSFSMHQSARAIIESVIRSLKRGNWNHITLMREGILEWVRIGHRDNYGVLGEPRRRFVDRTCEPTSDPVSPTLQERRHTWGFRLVRRKST